MMSVPAVSTSFEVIRRISSLPANFLRRLRSAPGVVTPRHFVEQPMRWVWLRDATGQSLKSWSCFNCFI